MADFKNNKDSKLNEIKVSLNLDPHVMGDGDRSPAGSAQWRLTGFQADIAKRKKEQGKRGIEVKSRQKEVQTAELELRTCCFCFGGLAFVGQA